MLGKKSFKKNPLINDIISVQDIILEYIIENGWKDYNKFARKLTDKIVEVQPTTQEELAKLIKNFSHSFFTFNNITKEEFLVRFPLKELLRQSRIPRQLEQTKQRRTKKRKALSKKLRYLIMERDGFKCCICGRTAKETKLEVDHKIPVSKGGTDSLDNLWTLCIDCNRGKSDLVYKP
ncbi:MAG: HNH endonuclease, partial [Candidatus Bathyarchaeia archaeon]